MKRIIYVVPILLYITLSISFSQDVETLWRKGGTLPYRGQFMAHGRIHNGGWYFDNAHIYELEGNDLFLYNLKTEMKEKVSLQTNANLIACSPQCLFIITARNDSMFSYNVMSKESVFLREGFVDVSYFEQSGTYLLLKNGEVYDISSGVKINTVENFEYDFLRFFYDGTIIFLPNFKNNTIRIKDIVTNNEFSIKYWGEGSPTISGSLALSPDKKNIIQCSYNVLTIMDILGDTVKNVRSIIHNDSFYLYSSFADTHRFVVLKTVGYKCVVQYININTLQIEKTDTLGTDNNYYVSNFTDVLVHTNNGINNIYSLRTYFDDDCGGMPGSGSTHRYIVVNPNSNKPISVFPDIVTPHERSILFTEENTSLSFISRQNTIETFDASNSEKISSWQISPYYLSGFGQYAVGNKVLSHSSNLIFHNQNKLYSFSLKSGLIQDSIVFGNDTLLYIKPTVDGRRIVCPTKNNSIYIIDKQSFSIKTSLNLKTTLSTVALNDDTLFYCTSDSKYVKRYNIRTQEMYDSIFVSNGVKVLGSDGETFIPSTKIEITRLKNNIALKNISLDYHIGALHDLNIAAVDNIPGYWKIHENLQSHPDTEGYAHIFTMQEYGDTLIHRKVWKNELRCYTNDIVFSDDGRYCATISNDAFEVHNAVGLISSVNEEENQAYTPLSHSAYYVDGNTLVLKDESEYERCTLYSLTGGNYGNCLIQKSKGETEISIPSTIVSGMYMLQLHYTKLNKERRVLIIKM